MPKPYERKVTFEAPKSKTVFVQDDNGHGASFNWESALTLAQDPHFAVQSELIAGDGVDVSFAVES